MLAVKDLIAISNGSACTSHSYESSHVLAAMQLPEDRIRGALRLSWSHLTPHTNWEAIIARLMQVRQVPAGAKEPPDSNPGLAAVAAELMQAPRPPG